jgi:hypothetical protein
MRILLLALFSFLAFFGFAQKNDSLNKNAAFSTLDANNWSVSFNTTGSNGWDLKGDLNSWFPKKDSGMALFAFSLWCGGLNNDNLYTMAETYRQFGGADGQPGTLNNNGDVLSDSTYTSERYNYIYKVSDHEINNMNNGVITTDIENWPGNGDVSLGESDTIAPFVDVDNDGIYDSEKGDFPKINGNQMLYRVFNDNRLHHESGGERMQIEVHMKSFSFNCDKDEVLKNTFFVEYSIINKSARDYDSFKVGMWSAVELGRFYDNAMGSVKDKAAFFYNYVNIDSLYPDSIPMLSIYSVDRDLTSSISYGNDFTIQGNPRHSKPTDFYNYLNAHWKNGYPMIEDSLGISYRRRSTIPETKFMYHGNPFDTTQWNWKKYNFRGGFIQTVSSVGPYFLKSKDTITVVFAFTGHWKHNDNPEKQYFNMIDEIDHVKQLYVEGKLENACPTPIGMLEKENNELSVYPNPTDGVINIEIDQEIEKIELFNSIGQMVLEGSKSKIDLSHLKNGVYYLKVRGTSNKIFVGKIIKE